jgi:uncharacterized membrane protein
MAKTISFAVMHFSVAFSVAWMLTGDFVIGGLLAVVEPAINTIAYYFHEKIWQKLKVVPQHPEKSSSSLIAC